VPTDTVSNRTRAASFLLRAAAWSLVLFGLLRLTWVEEHGLLPLTQVQGCLAAGLCGTPAQPVTATLACSGADLLAICLGAILAYPVRWRARLAGAGFGVALILGLNTLRIGTLGRLAASPSMFNFFHVYLWPAALTLAVAGYVFAWMRLADRTHRAGSTPVPASTTAAARGENPGFRPTRRFALLAAAFLLIFTASSPLYLQSSTVLGLGAFVAHASAALLRLLGVEARAAANHLWTSRGSFVVTQECISTPLIPIYLAAVVAFGGTWRRRLPGLLAALPLFVSLGIARLLVVALPASLAVSPDHLIHAFFQIVLAAVFVVLAARWREPDRGAVARRAILGAGLGSAFFLLLGAPYTRGVLHAARVMGGAAGGAAVGEAPQDPQGAIALLPAFQAGLFLALWVAARGAAGWKRFVAGLALLGASQLAALRILPLLAGLVSSSMHVQGVRGWSVVAPALIVAFTRLGRPPAGTTRVALPPRPEPSPDDAARA
jgi:exosortase/archaeosortase family protein